MSAVANEATKLLIEELITNYKDREGIPRRHTAVQEIEFSGKRMEIQTYFNNTGSEIYSLVNFLNFLNLAYREGNAIHAIGNSGVSYRDLEFLRFCQHQKENNVTVAELEKKYSKLSGGTIKKTLGKLENNDCIQIEDDEITLTLKGRVINIAGK
ncbi:hypothetical protein [Candidatus Uabimicrobium sp. HlEnr_7]|uniref:hypothetical protein n=1 Tax=Candidatus Uabimicrobium helgolandensis TaxID=3095367 RepID=UPI003557A157